jgi:hypothetical protein
MMLSNSLNIKRYNFTYSLSADGALSLRLKDHLGAGTAQTHVLARFGEGVFRVCQANNALLGISIIRARSIEPIGLSQIIELVVHYDLLLYER